MLWNIIDRRTNKYNINVDAVFEPAHHDNSIADASQAEEDESWGVTSDYNTTIRAAAHKAEEYWEGAVTIYIYDPGTRPIGRGE